MAKPNRYGDLSEGRLVTEPIEHERQPLCILCARFTGYSHDSKRKPLCMAFPDGIPSRFWDARADHTAPYGSDGGKTFIPK